MTHYEVIAEIKHDTTRKNSHYYANVVVQEFSSDVAYWLHSVKPSKSLNLEVVLNGGGESKARQRISKELLFRGIRPRFWWEKLPINFVENLQPHLL